MVDEQDKQQEEEKKNEPEPKTEDTEKEKGSEEPKADTVDKEELERLRQENEEFKQKAEQQQTQQRYYQPTQPTQELNENSFENAAAAFNNMAEEDYEVWASKNKAYQNKTQQQAIDDCKNTARDMRNQKLQSKININEVVDDALSKNPRLSKLKGDMKEYLSKLSLSERANENNLKNHIKDAERWALGGYQESKKSKQSSDNGVTNMDRVTPNMDIPKGNEEFKEESEYIGANTKNKIKVKNEKTHDGVTNTIVSSEDRMEFGR